MKFNKPAAGKTLSMRTTAINTVASSSIKSSVRWSDIAAGRKSTHPDAAPIKPVIDTPELCEMVLAYLELKDLLRMQHVCHAIEKTIKASPALLTRLFLKPVNVADSKPWIIDANHKLLAGDSATEYIKSIKATGAKPRTINPLAYNPLLLSMKNGGVKPVWEFKHNLYNGPGYYDYMYFNFTNVRYLAAEASCRSMYLSQPPVKKVELEMEGRRDYPPWEDRRGLPKWWYGPVSRPIVEDANGVTFGQLVNVICSEMNRHGGCSVENLVFHGGVAVSLKQKELVEARFTAE